MFQVNSHFFDRVNVLDQGKRERERERERGISFASVFVYVILQKR